MNSNPSLSFIAYPPPRLPLPTEAMASTDSQNASVIQHLKTAFQDFYNGIPIACSDLRLFIITCTTRLTEDLRGILHLDLADSGRASRGQPACRESQALRHGHETGNRSAECEGYCAEYFWSFSVCWDLHGTARCCCCCWGGTFGAGCFGWYVALLFQLSIYDKLTTWKWC